jgi:hypothetical protein
MPFILFEVQTECLNVIETRIRFKGLKEFDFEINIGFSFTSLDRKTIKLIPWRIVLLEKLSVAQLARQFPGSYGIRKILSVFT